MFQKSQKKCDKNLSYKNVFSFFFFIAIKFLHYVYELYQHKKLICFQTIDIICFDFKSMI